MQQSKGLKDFLWGVVFQIAVALSIFLVVWLFFLQAHEVDGSSMEPSFENGEYLLTDKISYKLTSPQRGDVIIFAAPPLRQEDYIKRLVGLPGDTVLIKEGKVFVNEKELRELYLSPETHTTARQFSTITLNPGEYFVLGDNRNHSEDSRSFGVIKRQDIVGRAWIVYWPLTRARIIPHLALAVNK